MTKFAHDANCPGECIEKMCRGCEHAKQERWLTEIAELRATLALESGYRRNAVAEAERLRNGIKRFLDGDYPNPSDHRPNKCSHERYWYEGCEQCADAFMQHLLYGEPPK